MSNSEEPSPGSAFWRTVKRIDKNKINNWWMAVRNSLAVAVPLGVGIEIGNPLGAVAISTGALNVSYSDGRDPYGQRARRMLLWSLLGAITVFIGSVTGSHPISSIVVAAAWAFVAGMLISISTHAGDLGLNTLVTLIVFAARGAMPLRGAFYAGLLVLAGGLLQTVFALFFWPVRRYEPERRVVGQVYSKLAKEIDPNADVLPIAPLAPVTTETEDTIAALGRDHSVAGERFRLLFDQADRLRLSIYLVSRLRDELGERDDQQSDAEGDAADHLDSLLRLTAKLLDSVVEALRNDRPAADSVWLLGELHRLTESIQAQKSAFPLAASIAAAVDALGGQLRLVNRLAANVTPQGEHNFSEHEQAAPIKLRTANWLATLRANLDFRSAIFRHAVRLSLCVALADLIERSVGWQRAYWLPMTAAVVLKPDFTATFSRGVLRLMGTFGGLVLATVLYHLLPQSGWTELLLVGIFTFFLRYLGPANYGVFTVAISGLIVFLIAATGTGTMPGQVVAARAVNTFAGGILALIAYALWPTWEKTQVSDAMADMLDACRLYVQAVFQRFGEENGAPDAVLDKRRREWRRTRSSAEASVDRVVSEPGITAARRDCLNSMLASSHALIHAIMGLEAGMLQAHTHTSAEVLKAFARDVDFTLYFLASALRGSSPAGGNLPRLREDHRRLLEARASFSGEDEYVLIETDRLTVSLNTLREQIMRYVSGC